MEKCSVYCVDTETEVSADILQKSDKFLKVVLLDSDITITLNRKDLRRPYIGFHGGYEFESFGVLED